MHFVRLAFQQARSILYKIPMITFTYQAYLITPKDIQNTTQDISLHSVTCKDVAALAGVSVASVCRVFDKKWEGRVSEKLRHQVLSAAETLKYHPNAFARIIP